MEKAIMKTANPIKRGLALADKETRLRVAKMGGMAGYKHLDMKLWEKHMQELKRRRK